MHICTCNCSIWNFYVWVQVDKRVGGDKQTRQIGEEAASSLTSRAGAPPMRALLAAAASALATALMACVACVLCSCAAFLLARAFRLSLLTFAAASASFCRSRAATACSQATCFLLRSCLSCSFFSFASVFLCMALHICSISSAVLTCCLRARRRKEFIPAGARPIKQPAQGQKHARCADLESQSIATVKVNKG